ncbi:MAG: cob(I)yrinic acid a,c-diamide adenosyltransferase [Eubacteriales bacterium]|nr:cob(I)yrinic acid a,c-diamide adenosyltransferase [Eubacteriales bacterium]
MNTGRIELICGDKDSGKTAMALGRAVQALNGHKQVIVIQFLKGSRRQESREIYKRLEPELKVFWFEKSDSCYEELSQEARQEERFNILNGLNYARKVMGTGECDLLILDEALGLVEKGIVTARELLSILEVRDEADVILTGKTVPQEIAEAADRMERIPLERR